MSAKQKERILGNTAICAVCVHYIMPSTSPIHLSKLYSVFSHMKLPSSRPAVGVQSQLNVPDLNMQWNNLDIHLNTHYCCLGRHLHTDRIESEKLYSNIKHSETKGPFLINIDRSIRDVRAQADVCLLVILSSTLWRLNLWAKRKKN